MTVGEGKRGEGREGGMGCGARRPAGARVPALAKGGPGQTTNDVWSLAVPRSMFDITLHSH